MKARIFLVLTKNGVRRMTKSPPAVKPDERSFAITLIIPDKMFTTPRYAGKLEVKEEDLDIVEKFEFELNLMKDWGEKQNG